MPVSRTLRSLSHNIEARMKERNWTPQQLQRASGVSPSTIRTILHRENEASTKIIERLADGLDCQPWELLC